MMKKTYCDKCGEEIPVPSEVRNVSGNPLKQTGWTFNLKTNTYSYPQVGKDLCYDCGIKIKIFYDTLE